MSLGERFYFGFDCLRSFPPSSHFVSFVYFVVDFLLTA